MLVCVLCALLLVLAGICIKSSAGFGEVANVVVRNTTVRSKYGKALESVVLRNVTHVHTSLSLIRSSPLLL